jgi:hypothetical protein
LAVDEQELLWLAHPRRSAGSQDDGGYLESALCLIYHDVQLYHETAADTKQQRIQSGNGYRINPGVCIFVFPVA